MLLFAPGWGRLGSARYSNISVQVYGCSPIDAKHSYEDAILPVAEAKKRYGNRIAILGGFDVDRLCRSDEKEIREHVGSLIKELGADGGYAFGSGNSIPDYVPIENYLIMLDQAWKIR